MKRRSYGRDAGLSLRMLLTGSLLGLLYVIFAVVLFQVLSVGLVPMLVIVVGLAFFQYFTSDKLALAASGAKVVERDQAPALHDMVERLCAMADLPKPKVAGEVMPGRTPVDKMPALPLVIGPGANTKAGQLKTILGTVPALQAQLASATWVSGRRWDLSFQSGETVALPESETAAKDALVRFAKMDRSAGLLGRGLVRFDLRLPGKMIVRLPRAPGEPIMPAPPAPVEG